MLRSVTLDLAPGEIIALRGDNGSGKSTLLRVACGRERPTSGTVLFDGAPLDEDAPAARARIATVLDTGAHYPDLTVREHLMLVALSHGLGPDAAGVVGEVLEEHHLAGHADVLPSALSSGQLQALALSAAFARPHDLLILDEPEQRLDRRARGELADRLAAHRDRGAAVLLATHHDALSAVADTVFTVDAGTLTRTDAGHVTDG
ncbi:ABC transporter ATP-binding protein [Streptomyces specialis]|uniref:ABC transporter ATP-binding protein n=1 Tax=Streptomyces specialis TaxID=498367 RepID=UPI000ABE46E1|nr:ABC transporter ATP-binding protein [Streptomyces specialis]